MGRDTLGFPNAYVKCNHWCNSSHVIGTKIQFVLYEGLAFLNNFSRGPASLLGCFVIEPTEVSSAVAVFLPIVSKFGEFLASVFPLVSLMNGERPHLGGFSAGPGWGVSHGMAL